MAANYEQFKQAWDRMGNAERRQYTEQYKNDSTFQQFAQQYSNEMKGVSGSNSNANSNQSTNTTPITSNGSNSNSSNGSNGYNSNNNNGNNQSDLNNGYSSSTNQGGSSLSDGKNGDGNTYGKFTFDADEFLDTSKFGESNGKITVEAGTGKDTGRPDYYAESDARLREMVDNLNTYWQTNPEFFSSREEFNKQFEYNQRESEAQRALLDSYWKKAQDYKKANSYSNGSSFGSDLSSGNVTESEFEALKQYNQKAYLEWQQQMQDKIDLAISNLTIPRSLDNITDALNTLVEKFNLQSGDPYNIIQGWEDMMTRTGAWDAMNQATKLYEEANSDIAKIKEIQSRYSSSTGGTQSDALIAARLQKATLPYETSLANKLSAGQHWQSLYQTKLGTANQYAQTIQMQAQEDQRIFNQKIAALGFAVTAYTTRTPEQQAQLGLQTAQIQNNMSLLQQSKQNDLSLYNQYATAKLNNQLAYELTDLTTTDPTQLRANLKNVLDGYYEKYGDIIKRSESQVIEDVIAYAKEKGISVAQALKENFIEPLQNKDEYKQAIRDAYNMNNKVEYIKTDNGIAIITTTPDGNVKVEYSNGGVSGTGTPGTTGIFTNYTPVSSETKESTLNNFMSNHPLDSTGGQCGSFVNDYLQSLGLSRLFVDPIDKKKAIKNSDTATVGSVAIMDSKNYPQYGHVAIITEVSGDKVKVLESNWGDDEKVHERWINKSDIYGYFDPSKQVSNQTTSTVVGDPHSTVSGTTAAGATVNGGGWITELEPYFSGQQKFMSTSDKTEILKDFGINNQDYMTMLNKYADWFSSTQLKKTLEQNLSRAEDLLDWEKKENSGWGDYHTGWLDQASISTDAEGNSNAIMGITTEANTGYNKYKLLQNNQTLETYLNLKAQGATFGAMQQAEWELIAGSVNALNWNTKKGDFKKELENLIQNYKAQLAGLGTSQDSVTEADIMAYAYSNIQSPNLNYSYDITGVDFILGNK